MKHIFDVDIAVKYGVNAAILLENIGYWIEKNEANGDNIRGGVCWTYNSVRAYRELFPYMTVKAISIALKRLEDEKLIISGNYNQSPYDKTKWYALTEKGKLILHNRNIDLPKRENRYPEKGEPIPYINTIINTDINTDSIERKRFAPPTAEEVKAYADEINAVIDADRFVDFYASKGWVVGRSPMKDWKAAVRNWAKKDRPQKEEREMVDVGGGEMIPW